MRSWRSIASCATSRPIRTAIALTELHLAIAVLKKEQSVKLEPWTALRMLEGDVMIFMEKEITRIAAVQVIGGTLLLEVPMGNPLNLPLPVL